MLISSWVVNFWSASSTYSAGCILYRNLLCFLLNTALRNYNGTERKCQFFFLKSVTNATKTFLLSKIVHTWSGTRVVKGFGGERQLNAFGSAREPPSVLKNGWEKCFERSRQTQISALYAETSMRYLPLPTTGRLARNG